MAKRHSYKKLHWEAMVAAKHHADRADGLKRELDSLKQLLAEMWEHTLGGVPESGALPRFDYACYEAYLEAQRQWSDRDEFERPFFSFRLLSWRNKPVIRDPLRLTRLKGLG